MNNQHIIHDVAHHATGKATEHMLSIIDNALDDDKDRILTALISAQSVYLSMLKAMTKFGVIDRHGLDASIEYVSGVAKDITNDND